jgi:hypothetical protein
MLSQGFDIFGIHIQYWMLLAAVIVTIAIAYIRRWNQLGPIAASRRVVQQQTSAMDSLSLGGVDMPTMIIAFGRFPAIEIYAADAAHHRAKDLWRQILSASVNGPDLGAAFAVVTVFLECAIWDIRLKPFPIGLEADPRILEGSRYPITMLSWVQTRVEAARPMPLIAIDRNTGAFADRAHVHVFEIDVPGDLMKIVGAAAGKAGHLPWSRGSIRQGSR